MMTCEKHKDGYYHWYWNGHDITMLWMDFFSGLPIKQEKNAHWIFKRRYTKELNRLFPKPQADGGGE